MPTRPGSVNKSRAILKSEGAGLCGLLSPFSPHPHHFALSMDLASTLDDIKNHLNKAGVCLPDKEYYDGYNYFAFGWTSISLNLYIPLRTGWRYVICLYGWESRLDEFDTVMTKLTRVLLKRMPTKTTDVAGEAYASAARFCK